LEQLVAEGIYSSKNEAIRDVLRQLFEHFGIFQLEQKKVGKINLYLELKS